jgi:hypothetical protein
VAAEATGDGGRSGDDDDDDDDEDNDNAGVFTNTAATFRSFRSFSSRWHLRHWDLAPGTGPGHQLTSFLHAIANSPSRLVRFKGSSLGDQSATRCARFKTEFGKIPRSTTIRFFESLPKPKHAQPDYSLSPGRDAESQEKS